jgi:two-component system, OmpR family, response regulator MtrA
MSKVLVIDDDPAWLAILARLLEQSGHHVAQKQNADQLIPAIKEFQPDLLITDIMMPGVSGSGVFQMVRDEIGPDLPILVCSSTRLKVKTDDPLVAHLTKHDAPDHLADTVEVMLGRRETQEDESESDK